MAIAWRIDSAGLASAVRNAGGLAATRPANLARRVFHMRAEDKKKPAALRLAG
jgi:hypothetical protein